MYIKQIAGLSNIRNEETGEKLLSKRFDKISFVGSDVALAKYLNPSLLQGKRTGREYIPIFPFGCNNSQYKAVKNAMENQISVIQGPPGTGKTQTILNIIANILMQGKTVQIVSNNNSATENVYEKLSSPKYNFGFVAATLGSSKNKKLFVEHQEATYPDFSSWKTGEDPSVLQKRIAEQSSQLKSVFDKQEKLACLRQELSQLVTEQEYFNQYVKESDVHTDKDDYTVVAWNQRGCGRTYYKNKDNDPYNDTATFEQAQADLDALVDYVCDRFQQENVILVGHSYGTMVGSKYAIEHPDKVAAYVGVGQMGAGGSDIYAYEDALSIAREKGDDTTAMIAAFEKYQADATLENMLALRSYVSPYHVPEKENNYIMTALTSPYLGVYDVLWFGKQLGNLSDFVELNSQLFDYISIEDVYAYGTEYQIPVGFISGSCDWITPVKYTEDYFHTITAPKKEMQLIDGWGHTVPQESPKEFADTLMQVLETITN